MECDLWVIYVIEGYIGLKFENEKLYKVWIRN